MQKHPALIGLKAMTRGTIRFQIPFGVLGLIFHLATRAAELPVNHLGTGLLHHLVASFFNTALLLKPVT